MKRPLWAMGLVISCLSAGGVTWAQEKPIVDKIKAASGMEYRLGSGGLRAGVTYYLDRDFTVVSLPRQLEGAAWIMTANEDKWSTGATFLTFTANRPVTVWLAWDSRGDQTKGGVSPPWLSTAHGWTRHADLTMEVTDERMGYFLFWSKRFPAGEVALGGNADPPADGPASNYLVVLVPQKEREP
jgi:hypothetical protein